MGGGGDCLPVPHVSPSIPTHAEAPYSVRLLPPLGRLTVGTVNVPVTSVIDDPMMTAPAQLEEYWTCSGLSIWMVSSREVKLTASGRSKRAASARLARRSARRARSFSFRRGELMCGDGEGAARVRVVRRRVARVVVSFILVDRTIELLGCWKSTRECKSCCNFPKELWTSHRLICCLQLHLGLLSRL